MAFTNTSTFKISDGHSSPVLGLGFFQDNHEGEVEEAVLTAINSGCRMIDTSPLYRNEEAVGAAIKKSGVPREELCIVAKLWNDSHGCEETIKALHESLNRLGVAYVDQYLIHSPVHGRVVESWDSMIELQRQGLIKSIGVANFSVSNLKELKKARPDNIPAINQFEVNPYYPQHELVEYCRSEGILIESSFPLSRGSNFDCPHSLEVAMKHNKTPDQILIRWAIQSGFVSLPKSHDKKKIKQFLNVLDFNIKEEHMRKMEKKMKAPEAYAPFWSVLTIPWEG